MLSQYGWSQERADNWHPRPDQAPCQPARVILEHRGFYTVITANGERLAELSGRLRHDAQSRLDLPAVGDWVVVTDNPQTSTLLVLETLPRTSTLLRKQAGETTEPQLVAANIDAAIMLMGLDDNFNIRRMERYLTAIRGANIQPIILLSKADLCDDVPKRIAEATAAAGIETPVHAIDLLHEDPFPLLTPWLAPHQTVVLLGSSGVGKSTLTNRLLGKDQQRTSTVSDERNQGRHTTTHRQLFILPNASLLIDTPGMREFQPWETDPQHVSDAFEDIELLAAQCQFRDCKHNNEPGCAIQEAIQSGELLPNRLTAFRKLNRELQRLAVDQSNAARIKEQQRRKLLTRNAKQRAKMSPKW